MKVLFNLFCRDIEAQMQFYAALLGAAELTQSRSPIYRALAVGDTEIGFNARAAYALLGLEARQPPAAQISPVTAYATFLLADPETVDQAVVRAQALGATVLKPPYRTYYGQWQAVLCDPEQQVFRVSAHLE